MAKDFDTRAALIKSGTKEFLKHGFQDASLRTICTNAKVTTGAFYAHFKKKEDLFAAIVDDDLADYMNRYDSMMARLTAHAGAPTDTEADFMQYLLEHRNLFRLLFNCAQGTQYEGFKDQLIKRFEETYQEFFDSHAAQPIDYEVVKTIVQMKFSQYMRMLFGNLPKSKVVAVTDQLAVFTRGGFEAMLQTTFEGSG